MFWKNRMRAQTRLPVALIYLAGIPLTAITTGCTNRPYNSPQEQAQNACHAFGPKTLSGGLIGTLGGAAGGAGIGALASGGKGAAIGAGVGAFAGLLGGMIAGNQMDKQDCYQAQVALQQIRYTAVGQPVTWTNPATGSFGSYTPLTAETAQTNGKLCRQVRQDTTLKDHQATSQVELTCRDANGNYTTIEPTPATSVGSTPS